MTVYATRYIDQCDDLCFYSTSAKYKIDKMSIFINLLYSLGVSTMLLSFLSVVISLILDLLKHLLLLHLVHTHELLFVAGTNSCQLLLLLLLLLLLF